MSSGYSRGGLWTNAEDEILKAAVSKYGLTQWSRCSSLLNRKTAKQCKARWNNWLSPEINKTDWAPKEDEKLLEMARILPNQWQTIAPLVGRTPNQCIERYQRLLDDIENNDSGNVNAEALQAIGPKVNLDDDGLGNIPESKPARPDAIDMDDDEREMISEARARLANTQGKKAKRKQRERILAQSRRVALLQKRRELKNAGINVKSSIVSNKQKKRNKNIMDYNADIPFEIKPESGLYDTKHETKKDLEDYEKFQKSVGGPDFANEKKKGKKRKQETKEKRGPIIISQEDINNEEELLIKRRKFDLPVPKFENNENQSKLGDLHNYLAQIAQEEGLSLDDVMAKTREDVGDDNKSWLRTKLLESSDSKIKRLGTDLKSFHNLQSSLLSKDEIEEEEEDEEEKVKEVKTKRKQSKKEKSRKKSSIKTAASILREKFSQLPLPKNDFEIGIDDSDEEDSATMELEKKPEVESQQQSGNVESDYGKTYVRSLAIEREMSIPFIDSKNKTLKQISEIPITFDETLSKLLDNEMVSLVISDYLKSEYTSGGDDARELENNPTFKNDIVKDMEQADRAAALELINKEVAWDKGRKQEEIFTRIAQITGNKSYAFSGLGKGEMTTVQNEKLASQLIDSIKNISRVCNCL